uniref:Uncharacterized protein n=1 Tax=Leptocylindrus danicus TaxID=163516 RepID=A0A7S2PQG5_9STRA|mmetsp:Transcript_7489/g.11139  ORF Transcript_7489/g.11139 Transcript_7489/m.11139 type:complete len:168 (+) Transcript_7489:41-544(+)
MKFGLATASSPSDSNVPDNIVIETSTPWVAASDGNLATLKKSLESLRLPITCADDNGYTLLHAAASYSQMEVLEWLTSQEGCDLNVQDSDGDTPLHHCDAVEAAQLLIERGASVDVKNNAGETPLAAKEAEINDGSDEESDSEDEDALALKKLVNYLRDVSSSSMSA